MRKDALALGLAFIFTLASGCGSGPDQTTGGSSSTGGGGPGASSSSGTNTGGGAASTSSSGTGSTSASGSGSSSGTGGASASSSGTGGAASSSTSSAATSSSSAASSSAMSSSASGMLCATNADCDNNLFCDGVETCVGGMCVPGVPPLMCNDGVSCTDDFCDEGSKSCKHVVNDNHCSDGQLCDGAEKCDPPNGAPMTGCVAGAPPNCDDGIPCTMDACDEALKKCDHTPSNIACTDGIFCNGVEVCDPVMGCVAGVPLTCDDGLACTIDSCNEAQKQCVHTPNNAFCDDGLYCDGVETCSVNGPAPSGCVAGAPVACPSDGIACTDDLCNEATKACTHVANNNNCPMGQLCSVQQGMCVPKPNCATNADCQDNTLCNGVEVCVAGVCQPGVPVNCDDGIACTADLCNPATGVCGHTPNNAVCDNGLVCDGVETCNAQLGCVSAPPVNCDDGIACTFDFCQEPAGTCSHFANDQACSDGKLCNGAEVCDPQAGCKPGVPFVCPSDGIACTDDYCDPMLNTCVYVPNDNLCPCTQTCNAQQGGCGNFCNVATCQGKVYQCGDCLDNDGDCKIDSADNQCLGPCDNTEDTFYGGIPGQNNSPCKMDCYFDADTGAGNDDCYWNHKCDPFEVPPNYPPESSQCAYDPNANTPGTNKSCSQLDMMQSAQCLSYCGPLTPNGCDCFGCCAIPGAPTTVYLGSENPPGMGSCDIAHLNNPLYCKPCTQVPACLNPCDPCEICFGKPTPDPGCGQQSCPAGKQPCGLPGQPQCPLGSSCITGCCQQNPG